MNADPGSEGALAAGAEEPRNLAWGLFSIAWAHFLNDGGANYLPAVLPAILIALDIRLALVGVVMAALLFGQALQPICGWIADRIGGSAFVLAGVTLSTVAGAIVGIAPGYYSLLGVLLMVGMGSALFHPQALAAVRAMAPRRQGLYISTFLIGGELGRGLWPMAAAMVVDYLGLRALLLLAIPTLLTLPMIVRELPRLPPRSSESDISRASLSTNSRPMAILVAYSSMRAAVMYSLLTFLPLLWKQQGGSLVGGAGLITTLLTVGVLGNLAGGHLSDYFSRKSVVVGATALSAVFLALYLVSGGLAQWVILGGLGTMVYATFPLQILIAQDLLPDSHALGSGLVLGFANGIGVAAMMPFGPLAEHWSIPAVLWLNVGLTVLALGLALLLPATGSRAE